jgi:pimeloyl-ACP methyl ester carboxylesterase
MTARFVERAARALVLIVALLLAQSANANIGQRKIIAVNGSQIEAFVYGKGPQTLIIAAGNGRPAAQLDDLARRLSSGKLRVIIYNYRTIGASTGAIDGLTLHDYAADLWHLADAFGAKRVHLAGKTFGNRVVRAAAQARPERVISIVLVGAGGELPPTPETMALYRRYVDPATPKDEWRRLQGTLMYAPGNEHLAVLDAAHGEFPVLAAAQVKASEATPKAEWSSGGKAPMLVLTCMADRIAVPEGAMILAKSRPDTWLVAMPGCGHNMLNERPDDLVRIISGFIARQKL